MPLFIYDKANKPYRLLKTGGCLFTLQDRASFQKKGKTPPPVTGLIKIINKWPAAHRAYVTKRGLLDCSIPAPSLSSDKVSHDRLNKNTASVEVLAGHLRHTAPPLKGAGSAAPPPRPIV